MLPPPCGTVTNSCANGKSHSKLSYGDRRPFDFLTSRGGRGDHQAARPRRASSASVLGVTPTLGV